MCLLNDFIHRVCKGLLERWALRQALAELPRSLRYPLSPVHSSPGGLMGLHVEGGCSYSILQPLLYMPHFWINTFKKAFLALFLQESCC